MRTIVDLPDEQLALLKKLSEQSRLSRAELMRRAVAEYLARHGSQQMDAAFGIWRDGPCDGLEHQRSLRDEWNS